MESRNSFTNYPCGLFFFSFITICFVVVVNMPLNCNTLRVVFDTACDACLNARNEIGKFLLPSNSKYVVCFNKILGWKRFL